MDEHIQQKLLEMGYVPEKATPATPTDVYALFEKHLSGLVLFSGRVIARNLGFTVVLENENMSITTSKIDEERSLYINPLEKRIREEYIRVNGILNNDKIRVEEKVIANLDAFYLSIEDARENKVASFEFQKNGGMLYVPKRSEK